MHNNENSTALLQKGSKKVAKIAVINPRLVCMAFLILKNINSHLKDKITIQAKIKKNGKIMQSAKNADFFQKIFKKGDTQKWKKKESIQ